MALTGCPLSGVPLSHVGISLLFIFSFCKKTRPLITVMGQLACLDMGLQSDHVLAKVAAAVCRVGGPQVSLVSRKVSGRAESSWE